MKNIKIFILIGLVIALPGSCVDDYMDANPPRPLDGPALSLLPDETLSMGETTSFSVNVIEAPGMIDSVAYSLSEDIGTLVVDEASVNALIGKESGSFNVTYTAPTATEESEVRITFVVYDAQSVILHRGVEYDQRKSAEVIKVIEFEEE